MASLRRRKGKWQVQVRRKGHNPLTRTFIRKEDAQIWAIQTEADLQRVGLAVGIDVLRHITLKEILERYRDTVTIHKTSRENETIAINAILRHPFVNHCLTAITAQNFAEFRDIRLTKVKSSTLNREFTILSHVYSVAKSEWGLPLTNPVATVRRPKADAPRNRRLNKGELDRVLASAKECRNKHIRPTIQFALQTAMRRGEVLTSSWDDINWEERTLLIPRTKNGFPRDIPLTSAAVRILHKQKETNLNQPFPITVYALKQAWRRLVSRAGITNLHFHDLRHEAISRFFEMGLSVPEVALISGHKDYRMLARYTHLRAEDVGRKLERLQAASQADS